METFNAAQAWVSKKEEEKNKEKNALVSMKII